MGPDRPFNPAYVQLRVFEVDDIRDDDCGALKTEEYGDGKIPYGTKHGEWVQVRPASRPSGERISPPHLVRRPRHPSRPPWHQATTPAASPCMLAGCSYQPACCEKVTINLEGVSTNDCSNELTL